MTCTQQEKLILKLQRAGRELESAINALKKQFESKIEYLQRQIDILSGHPD